MSSPYFKFLPQSIKRISNHQIELMDHIHINVITYTEVFSYSPKFIELACEGSILPDAACVSDMINVAR